MEPMEIRANFKQATVKGGTAVLQLEILTSDASAFPILKLSGKPVVLTVADIRDELPLDYDEEDEGDDGLHGFFSASAWKMFSPLSSHFYTLPLSLPRA